MEPWSLIQTSFIFVLLIKDHGIVRCHGTKKSAQGFETITTPSFTLRDNGPKSYKSTIVRDSHGDVKDVEDPPSY